MNQITDARLAAQRMIQLYGDDAGAEAAKRAQAAKAARQAESEEMWLQIGKAIDDIIARTGPL